MSRQDIYYWKCDRPAAFHGTEVRGASDALLESRLHDAMTERLGCKHLKLTVAASQGNHLTWKVDADGSAMFVRLENGPELDDYIEIESEVMRQVRAIGVAVPEVFAVDASRTRVAGAWQALECVPFPDLNHWFKAGTLNQTKIAFDIGVAVSRWQEIRPVGYGPFKGAGDEECGRDFSPDQAEPGLKSQPRSGSRPAMTSSLVGYHARYEDYFRLRLDEHLSFLLERQFLNVDQRSAIEQAVDQHATLLSLDQGCLVHKDLALWNILGSEHEIASFIDFDDAISGDPMDDLSLLACFHDAAFLQRAFEGYQTIRPLPENYRRRFWLHLLRNMIVKAVIRVGAGYFERDSGFFLIGSGGSGADLRRMTEERLNAALMGLRENASVF